MENGSFAAGKQQGEGVMHAHTRKLHFQLSNLGQLSPLVRHEMVTAYNNNKL
ncbi:hypothetical protein V2A60_000665 [Cordyceps javanica]